MGPLDGVAVASRNGPVSSLPSMSAWLRLTIDNGLLFSIDECQCSYFSDFAFPDVRFGMPNLFKPLGERPTSSHVVHKQETVAVCHLGNGHLRRYTDGLLAWTPSSLQWI